jgi:21S rRNA (uridine2791-2'-O)-methyltransferase
MAGLTFAFDTVRTGGHYLCKFYQGPEDKALETKLKRLFAKVTREKPDSSRSVRSASTLTCPPLM